MYPEKQSKQLAFRTEPLFGRRFREDRHDEALKTVVVDASWTRQLHEAGAPVAATFLTLVAAAVTSSLRSLLLHPILLVVFLGCTPVAYSI
ncbi:hypothetical protein VNO80_29510 [Phaseolus coccineus]|uniref:Uncharacterized protein n=1 Tax=Phaseolus coccineus TaxID=3886 RepID=A0AAN9LB31_PHACN